MRRYLPAFAIVLLIYLFGYWLCLDQLSKWEGEAKALHGIQEQRKHAIGRMHDFEQKIKKEREQIIPYREFYQAWGSFLENMNLANVLEVIDEMTMRYGLGVSRRSTAQRQDVRRGSSGGRMQIIHLNVTGEYKKACQFLYDLSFRVPMLRVDTLRIRSSGMGRVDVGLHFSFPEL